MTLLQRAVQAARTGDTQAHTGFYAALARYVAGLASPGEFRQHQRAVPGAADLKIWVDCSAYTLSQAWRSVQRYVRGEPIDRAADRHRIYRDDLHFIVDHLAQHDLQMLWLTDDGALDRPTVVLDHLLPRLQDYCTVQVRLLWRTLQHDRSLERHDVWSDLFCVGMSAAFELDWSDESHVLHAAMAAARNRGIDLTRTMRQAEPLTQQTERAYDPDTVRVLDLLHQVPGALRAGTQRVLDGERIREAAFATGVSVSDLRSAMIRVLDA